MLAALLTQHYEQKRGVPLSGVVGLSGIELYPVLVQVAEGFAYKRVAVEGVARVRRLSVPSVGCTPVRAVSGTDFMSTGASVVVKVTGDGKTMG